ncbi:hypothetical protein CASFOL_016412 [Castilleja foliolosa]|uniref:non-specific serine/threonine protein kinase n=1 Tax=Castilleja foliolosa TaxID=1961234 RepID=A0ABD3DHW7_9LAMI
MATHFLNTSIFALFIISLFPFANSLSTIAISETGNQTTVCAISHSVNRNQQLLNCTVFPQRIQFPLNSSLTSVSSVVAGNGFICVLSSFYPSSTSVMVCWRFSNFGNNITYTRIYNGPILKDLNSGNSHVCGLVNGSNSLQCWPWRDFNHTVNNNISSSLAVGDDFVCGLSDSGQVQCFGNGIGSAYNMTDEMPVRNVRLVEAGFRHACAVSVNGSLECWGTMSGQRPDGEFTSLALAENRSCAIRSGNGTVICWGENGFGLPGSLRGESFISIESKRTIFCGVVSSNYSLFCWGNEDFDSNPLVFNRVVPGPCRPRNECACDNYLPNYGEYCDQGLVICQPCVEQHSWTNILPPPPPPLLPPPAAPPPPSGNGKKWNSVMLAVLVVGCIGSFSSLLVLCVFLFSRYIKIRGSRIHDSGRLEEGRSGSDRPSGPIDIPQPHPTAPRLEKKISHMMSMGSGGHLDEFPLEELLKATGNFSDEHKIGSGSFGSVYHATLDDGRKVAVKRAEFSSSSSYAGPTKRREEDKDLAFMNELEFLSKLNHKNLVRLLGFCEDSDERVLVYEYMENGTLFDHLHKLQDSPLLSWATRIKVALDAARGIEYLHEYSNPQIIHRDIKSSNILLDDDWTAKVSDFGLSLMGPQDGKTHLSLLAAGTMGYMDPEYYRLQVLTTNSDVYSFGIVLLELLSGCNAIHKNENGVPRNVVDYVVPYIVQDELHRVLDRRVPPPTPFEIEAVAYVGYLAADCVALKGTDRPTMSDVVSSLDRALEACLAPPVLSRSTTSST